MSIIKSLVCAVLFLVQVANADFYVNCMAAPDATPDALECSADVQHAGVLEMLNGCTNLDMAYVEGMGRRRLLSPEQAEQTKRELQDPDNGCYSPNQSSSYRWFCCYQTQNKYSYCGSPTGDRKLQAAGFYSEAELTDIADTCTAAFNDLATEAAGNCFGSADEVFCETIQILVG
jgi:hypothetical protein